MTWKTFHLDDLVTPIKITRNHSGHHGIEEKHLGKGLLSDVIIDSKIRPINGMLEFCWRACLGTRLKPHFFKKYIFCLKLIYFMFLDCFDLLLLKIMFLKIKI